MFSKLKARAAAVRTISDLLTQAERIAHACGAERPAAEHLVLAALELPDGTAARALERVGSSTDEFRSGLDAQEAEDLARVGVHPDTAGIQSGLPRPTEPQGLYESEPSAQELFQAAGDEARQEDGSLVSAHVLRAAAQLSHGSTARALRRLGIERTDLRAAATAEIEAQRGI